MLRAVMRLLMLSVSANCATLWLTREAATSSPAAPARRHPALQCARCRPRLRHQPERVGHVMALPSMTQRQPQRSQGKGKRDSPLQATSCASRRQRSTKTAAGCTRDSHRSLPHDRAGARPLSERRADRNLLVLSSQLPFLAEETKDFPRQATGCARRRQRAMKAAGCVHVSPRSPPRDRPSQRQLSE